MNWQQQQSDSDKQEIKQKLLQKLNQSDDNTLISKTPNSLNLSLNIPYQSFSNVQPLNSSIQKDKLDQVEIISSSLKQSNSLQSKIYDSNKRKYSEDVNANLSDDNDNINNQGIKPRRFKTDDIKAIIEKNKDSQPQLQQQQQKQQQLKQQQDERNFLLNQFKDKEIKQQQQQQKQQQHQSDIKNANQKISSLQKAKNDEQLILTLFNSDKGEKNSDQFVKRLLHTVQILKSQQNKLVSDDNDENSDNNNNNVKNKIIDENEKQQKQLVEYSQQQQQQKQINKDEIEEQLDYEIIDEETYKLLNNDNDNDKNIELCQLFEFKEQIKLYLNVIHHSDVMISIRKQYRSRIFKSLVLATFFQFFVDNFISQIESVLGQYMYQDQLFSYSQLSQRVTFYYSVLNIAFFPILNGFIIDQIYCSFVMNISIWVLFVGRMTSLAGILLQSYQIRILGQFFYLFGDSGFYLTSIYTIYFYYYDPNNTKKFVKKLVKYLAIGCALPRNLTGIPMIFVYISSTQLFNIIQNSPDCGDYCSQYLPLLFGTPYKYVIYSIISCLVLVTVFFAFRAKKTDLIAIKLMSSYNHHYLENPLFKTSFSDIKELFKSVKIVGTFVAGGIIYGLTYTNLIYGINKYIYDQINPQLANQRDLTLFVITSGHELVYVMFIWSFGKKIMKDFNSKYKIWRISGWSCFIYYSIHLCLWQILISSESVKEYISNSSIRYIIYIFLFIINVFSGISFSTNVLCVDSIIAKNINKQEIGTSYALMIVFKNLFLFFGDISLYYLNSTTYGLTYLSYSFIG